MIQVRHDPPAGHSDADTVWRAANFVGNIAVPLALIMLGAAFARLRVPRPLSRLPIMAMLAVTVVKMVVLPVVGIVMVQAMVRGGLIPREARAERFVAMFLSGTPAAVKYGLALFGVSLRVLTGSCVPPAR